MEQFLPPIIEWLGTKHGGGRHEYYGWVIIALLAISIAKRISVAEKTENRRSLHKRQLEYLQQGPLLASIHFAENGVTTNYIARIKAEGESYRLTIQTANAGNNDLLVDEFARTIEDIESIIKQRSHFSISDFKPAKPTPTR